MADCSPCPSGWESEDRLGRLLPCATADGATASSRPTRPSEGRIAHGGERESGGEVVGGLAAQEAAGKRLGARGRGLGAARRGRARVDAADGGDKWNERRAEKGLSGSMGMEGCRGAVSRIRRPGKSLSARFAWCLARASDRNGRTARRRGRADRRARRPKSTTRPMCPANCVCVLVVQ